MRAVDTNVLVRVIVRDDPEQAEAADAFVAEGVWVPLVALAEAVWVLDSVYDRSAAEIAWAVERLLDHRELTLQDPDVIKAALDRFRERPSVGFTDCLVLESARRAGCLPLGTFDKGLAKFEGALRL